jgi:23S rRNA pseudouridine2457 synthase
MTAAVGYPTLRLLRVRVGKILLNEMKPGEVIEVDEPFIEDGILLF